MAQPPFAPNRPLILAVAFVNSILIIGVLTYMMGRPAEGRLQDNLPALMQVVLGVPCALVGVVLAFRSAAMTGWSRNGTRLEPHAVPSGAPDSFESYGQRATKNLIIGYACVEAPASFGLVASLAFNQREWGVALAALSFLCGIASMVPALAIRANSILLQGAEASQPRR